MRILAPAFLFLLIFLRSALPANAQICTGSLGDPVIDQDFGTGTNPGPALPAGATNYTYTAQGCPQGGEYTIANSTNGCFAGDWLNVPKDHTGNANGYMMIVNASSNPGVFFTQQADGLCPNTVYEFAAWILNLDEPTACRGASTQPNITFNIFAADGTLLKTYNTKDIQPSSTVKWLHPGTSFKTPANVTSVIVQMVNNAPGGCGNDLALDDITFRPCGPIIESGFGTPTGQAETRLCQGETAQLTLEAQVVAGNGDSQWQENSSANSLGWVDLPNSKNKDQITVFIDGTPGQYQYRLGVANGSDLSALSCRVYSQPLTVDVDADPVIVGVNPVQPVCEGQDLQLSASGGVTYQWSGPNLAATSQNPVTIKNTSLADAGTYTVTAYDQYSCSSTTTTNVIVYPKVTAAVSNKNLFICKGDTAQLNASGGTTYSWSPGVSLSDSTVANPLAFPLDTTIYTVKVTNSSGCSDTATVTVNVLRKAIANAGVNKKIFEGQSVKMTASQQYGSIFYWTPTTALDDPNVLDPVASPLNDITYTLHVTSASNCVIDSNSVFVRVYQKITIPNTFSPNNDGINDYWNIKALSSYPDCVLTVYDRNGQQVYRSVGYNKPWNGKYNGQYLPAGTYYYVLDLKNNTPTISGWVLLAR